MDTSHDNGATWVSPGSREELTRQLEILRTQMRERHASSASVLESVHPSHRLSAANLLDYLTLRQYDLRDVQLVLAELGLSSLGRSEEHVITSLERVIDNLHVLSGVGQQSRTEAAVSFAQGRAILATNADALLGPLRRERSTRILVTMPSEAATNLDLVTQLMRQGMDCARINCAHVDEPTWLAMVDNIHRAATSVARHCPILMDLPGPKLRTGPIEEGPKVLRLRPTRDARGRVSAPARAVLSATCARTGPRHDGSALVPVPQRWLNELRVDDLVTLRDTRGARRALRVIAINAQGAAIEVDDTTYLETGTVLRAPGGRSAEVGDLEPLVLSLTLHVGDTLTLTRDLTPARATGDRATSTSAGTTPSSHPVRARIGCTSSEVLDALDVGHRVFFDDGRIGGVVTATRSGEADILITSAAQRGAKLKAEKGINVPDSELQLAALGPDDERILAFVVQHADLVELSFAQSVADIVSLQEHLARLASRDLGIIIKIETVRGFNALPDMLLAAMANERVGVMVARGDLAVECGFERLAEVQEEILWLCDAAHIPVIWATEVLDQMARTGQPSRAEVSDAAMAGRAECVMLNKGPYIEEAVAALDDIISRMSTHQNKKMNLLRRLTSWSEPID